MTSLEAAKEYKISWPGSQEGRWAKETWNVYSSDWTTCSQEDDLTLGPINRTVILKVNVHLGHLLKKKQIPGT